jgi:hypothetical protein
MDSETFTTVCFLSQAFAVKKGVILLKNPFSTYIYGTNFITMKKHLLTACLAFSSLFAVAQTNLVAVETLNDQWGFADEKGNLVIPCKFIEAHSFMSGGVAMVRDANGWKVIDAAGERVNNGVKGFEPKSYPFFTRGFKGEMLLIVVEKKYGYLDSKGQLAVPVEYDELSEFRGDYAIGKIGSTHYIVDKKGNKTTVNVTADLVRYVTNGYAVYRYKKLFGYIDAEGNKVIDPKYTGAGNFVNGYAWAREASDKIGFINTKGEWLVQPEYKDVTDPDEIYQISTARDFTGKFYLQKMDGSRTELSGATGAGELIEGCTWVRTAAGVGMVNHKGEWILQPTFTKVEKAVDGYVVVKSIEDKEGLYNLKGENIIPVEYDKVENISEGLFRVRKGDKWGYMNTSGEVVIDFQFAGAEDFNYGYAQVKEGTTWGLIDKSGNIVIPAKYKRIKELVSF